jgi:UPF0148 protein
MSKELTKRAVEMLLQGATLVRDPCPYCKGVRIMNDGSALCVTCGKEEKKEPIETIPEKTEQKSGNSVIDTLDQKIKELADALQKEKDYEKQKQILYAMNEVIATKERLAKI